MGRLVTLMQRALIAARITRVRGRLTCHVKRIMTPNLSFNPDASPAVLARRPLGAG